MLASALTVAGVPPVAAGVVAKAGGTKPLATPITAAQVQLGVVATAADSVVLPPAKAGLSIIVSNDGVAAAQIFGAGNDTIDGVAAATGVVLSNAKRAIFFSVADGAWLSLGGVKSA